MRLISFPVKDVKEVTIRTLWEPPSSFRFLLLLSPKPQHQALLVPHWPSPSQSSPGDAWSQLGRDTEPGGQSWTGTGTSGKPSAPVGIPTHISVGLVSSLDSFRKRFGTITLLSPSMPWRGKHFDSEKLGMCGIFCSGFIWVTSQLVNSKLHQFRLFEIFRPF